MAEKGVTFAGGFSVGKGAPTTSVPPEQKTAGKGPVVSPLGDMMAKKTADNVNESMSHNQKATPQPSKQGAGEYVTPAEVGFKTKQGM